MLIFLVSLLTIGLVIGVFTLVIFQNESIASSYISFRSFITYIGISTGGFALAIFSVIAMLERLK